MMISQKLLTRCQQIFKDRGPLYYKASQLFPQDIKQATYVIYAFFRITDDIVDVESPKNLDTAKEKLGHWQSDWQRLTTGQEAQQISDSVLLGTYNLAVQYGIPFHYFRDFLTAMQQDTTKSTYKNYAELEQYMYGSAACVGGIMTYILGFDGKEETLGAAYNLGYAMQLTNFLRDIDEDYQERTRIYLPQDRLKKYNVTDETFAERKITPELRKLIQQESSRARQLFKQSRKGINGLSRGRQAIWFASWYYEGILDVIKKSNHDVFNLPRRYPPTYKVIIMLVKSFFK